MNILVVEDEVGLSEAICHILGEAGYHVEAALDGDTGLSRALEGGFDAIVLDVMLPGRDGFEIVHELRRVGSAVPVLMLTARTATTDKVEGLDAGADDYMTKPFENEELLARLRALTRRSGEVVLDVASFGDLTLDLATHDLACEGRTTHLSGKEYEVMRLLMSTQKVLSKQDLLARVWADEPDASENSVEAYVSFLRKKISHLRSKVMIATLRMLGYRLEYNNYPD